MTQPSVDRDAQEELEKRDWQEIILVILLSMLVPAAMVLLLTMSSVVYGLIIAAVCVTLFAYLIGRKLRQWYRSRHFREEEFFSHA